MRPILFTFGYRLLFPLLPKGGTDGPSRQKYEENGVPGWRRLCEGNENPAVVLAREFSISDSANPFYLKLRNSIPLPFPRTPLRHEGIHPRDFSTPLGISCPRPPPSSVVFVPHNGGGGDEHFYIFQRAVEIAAASPPTRIFRFRDIGQQKLKSSIYSYTHERSKTATRLSRVFKRRDMGILQS